MSFKSEKSACAFYFACPGLLYGLFVSRIPALKLQAALNDAQLGLVLFALGGSAFLGLLLTPKLLQYLTLKKALFCFTAVSFAALFALSLMPSFVAMAATIVFLGFGLGVMDVGANAEGLRLEHVSGDRLMNALHAFYSGGALTGSLFGALGTWLALSVPVNFLALIAPLFFFLFYFGRRFSEASLQKEEKGASGKKRTAPPLLYLCGLMALCAYDTEGSVGEWGSVFLTEYKGAEPAVAALVFGLFSGITLFIRLFSDRFRARFGDLAVLKTCGVISTIGMTVALFAPGAAGSLCGYAIVAAGLSSFIPTIFCVAEKIPGTNPIQSTATIASMAYAGLLFFPPVIGSLASLYTLQKALLLILFLNLVILSGSFYLSRRVRQFAGEPKKP